MGTDYKVPFRRDENIGDLARRVRRGFSVDNLCTFNIAKAIERLEGEVFGSAGKLTIRRFNEDEESLAYVTFSPLTLHVHSEIWSEADLGEPKARFILAHELGHVLMHRHNLQAFSDDAESRLKFPLPQESAEAQANLFAAHLLAPDHLIRNCANSFELCMMFDYPGDYAEDRLQHAQKRKRFYIGEACNECGNFTLVRSASKLRCDTCDKTSDCA